PYNIRMLCSVYFTVVRSLRIAFIGIDRRDPSSAFPQHKLLLPARFPGKMMLTDLTWSMWDWGILLLCFLVTLYVWGTWTHKHFKKRNIPYLKPVPFLGNSKISILGKNREHFPDYILRIYRELKDYPYGGTFSFMQPIMLLRDPELIKTITIKDFDHFTDHRCFFDESYEPLWAKTLFNLTGKRWKDMRSALSPAFTSSKMKTMFVLVNECCQQLVNFLEQYGDLLILELKDLYTRYSNDVIATAAFGIGVDSLKQPTNEFYMMGRKAFKYTNRSLFKMFGFLICPKMMQMLGARIIPEKATQYFQNVIHEAISTREQEGIVRPDMIQLLLQAKKGNLQTEKSEEKTIDAEEDIKEYEMDNDDITAQALAFFLAGFDTTSTLLCFASHQLAVHPEIQTRLQEEIDKTLQENGGKLTYEAVNSMKYLDMVVSETLRMFPPAVVGDRLCVKPYTVEGEPTLELQPGDTLFIPIYALHHDPNYFPDPERFDPERFNDENKPKINQSAYLPFGVGPRSCIGLQVEFLKIYLQNVFHQLQKLIVFVAKSPMPMKIIQTGFNMSVEGGFWFGMMSSLASFWVWALTINLIIMLLYIIGTWTHKHFSKKNVPCLKPLPVFGNMGPLAFGTKSFPEFIADVYNKLKGHKYGGFYEFLKPVVVLRDPELIKMVTIKDFEHFLDHRNLITEDSEPLFGKALFNLQGPRWRHMRSTLSPAFTSSKMKNMFTLVSECGDQMGDFLHRSDRRLEIEMKDLFTRYTNDVITTTALGIGCDSLKNPQNEFYTMGKKITTMGTLQRLVFLGYSLSPKLMK
ncbi:hypothetical protein L9F63_009047, partial [Diploptera punctata]